MFLGILSVSCDSNRKLETVVNSNTSTTDSLIALGFQVKDVDSSEIELNSLSRDYCLEVIAHHNEVHSAHIGEAGSKSEIYEAFECLESSFSIPELLPLLKHDSTAVRVYAYNAIIRKDSNYKQRAEVIQIINESKPKPVE